MFKYTIILCIKTAGCNLKSVFDWTIYTMLMFHVCLCFTSVLSQCFKGIAKNNGGFLVIASLGKKINVFDCLPWVLMCWLCMMQGEKECLNSETTELKQKIRYLQDQLLPLSKQREYQEKEIQRLNRVSVGLTTEANHRDASRPS